jgi:chromosome segregation ATPase
LRRLVPNGTYTLNIAHEEEIQRLRSLADSAAYERDALHRALRETLAALGNGSAATSEASVAFLANTPNEVRAVVDDLRRERDDCKTKLDAELPAAWREDLESLNRITEAALQRCDELRSLADSAAAEQGLAQRRMMQAQAERHQLREELARLHRLAPTGTYTVSLPHEQEIQALRDSRDKWAETARKLGEQLEWTNEMACENTPTPGCECPGCSLARDRARRGVAGPEDER